ncbi:MAG: PPOX class F420-dependent oxidoreductase [Ardenticatenaceae bacterium]|nr:PPOX class F420-dependent oxidoreductase [Ardenticatenaceae bacterium]
MQKMTPAEIRTFLTHGTRTGKLATVRANGRPHVAPIWFVLDGDDLLFTTWHSSVKGLNIQRDPFVTLCVDEEAPPFAFVIIEGSVTISADPDQVLQWATRIGGRYMGQEQAEAFGRRNGVPGELLVRLTPSKIIAQKDVAG